MPIHWASLVELVARSISYYPIHGSNGSQEHDCHTEDNVEHVEPKGKTGLLGFLDYYPYQTWEPECCRCKANSTKESHQVCKACGYVEQTVQGSSRTLAA